MVLQNLDFRAGETRWVVSEEPIVVTYLIEKDQS